MDFADNLYTNLLSLFSILIAGVTFGYYFFDRRNNKYTIRADYQKGLLDWYSKTIEILIHLRCDTLGNDREKILSQLSTQIEIGRFYFPNIIKDSFGDQKPLAYRGYRNLVLDFLVYSYDILKRDDYKENIDYLIKFQREYTSLVYGVIKPFENLQEIKKITDKYFIEEKILRII